VRSLSRAKTDPSDYGWLGPPAITIHVLKENKRPIGFAPWPEEEVPEEPKKRKKKAKK